MSPIPVAIELRARTASFKWQVSPLLYILFPGIGLGLSLRVKCPARVPLAGQHSSVAVARNVLHLEAVPLTERSTSLGLALCGDADAQVLAVVARLVFDGDDGAFRYPALDLRVFIHHEVHGFLAAAIVHFESER